MISDVDIDAVKSKIRHVWTEELKLEMLATMGVSHLEGTIPLAIMMNRWMWWDMDTLLETLRGESIK